MNWFDYLTSASSYSGADGITQRLVQHLEYSGSALFFTVLIGLPLGLILGHLHRGGTIVLGIANLGRAVPAFGIIVIFAVSAYGVNLATLTITLVLFALPQVLTNTYTGVAEIDPDIIQAAQGMGMSGRQILGRTELPVALPLIAAGIRGATVQIIGTATIAAYAGAGGLGAIVFRGYDSNDRRYQIGGAVLVVVLALVAQGLLGLLQRAVTPQPLRHRGIFFRSGQRQAARNVGLEASQQPAEPMGV
jgi:osmoprotectant transport system permease protein